MLINFAAALFYFILKLVQVASDFEELVIFS